MERIDSIKLKNVTESNEKSLVMFSTEWCGECKMNFPLVESFEQQYKDIDFYKVDVDELRLWSDDRNGDFSILSVPTFHLYEKGELINSFEGFINPAKLKEILG